ncbi:MAG: acyl-CoA synthetase [Rhodospirillales bacterium]|nr:acyl-CoA synthetase [Rhodospirillales bacterium]
MSGWAVGDGYRVYPPRMNITSEVVDRHVEEGRGGNAAVRWSGGSWTYQEFQGEINGLAAGLADLGVGKGDFILVHTRNHPRSCAAVFAALKLGAVPTLSASMLKEPEIEYILENSGARTVFAMDAVCEPLRSLKAKGAFENLIIVDADDAGAGAIAYLDVMKAAGDVPAADTDAMDPAFMLYSSGTTGKPKGILHAHRWIITVGDPILVQMKYRHDDIVLSPGEYSFMGAFGHAFMFPLYGGASIATLSERGTPENAFAFVEELGVTIFSFVPTFYRMALAEPGLKDRFDLSSLRFMCTMGEQLGTTACEQWAEVYGIPLYESYGVAEIEVMIGNGPDYPVKPGSIGRVLPGYKVALLDDELNEVGPGEDGVFMIHRSDPGLYLGYYKQVDRWRKQHRGDWYYTSDVMHRDEDGYYWYHGRQDDIFKSRGYLIAPQEIEDVVLKHPLVAEVAVTGIAGETRGKTIAAFVVLTEGNEGSDALAQEIVEFAGEKLARYKVPETMNFVDAIPKNPVGKLLRRVLVAG